MLAQVLSPRENYYVFPPPALTPALLRHLFSMQGPLSCTAVLPQQTPLQWWWPQVWAKARVVIPLAQKGALGALMEPSKHGFCNSKKTLPYDLYLARFQF